LPGCLPLSAAADIIAPAAAVVRTLRLDSIAFTPAANCRRFRPRASQFFRKGRKHTSVLLAEREVPYLRKRSLARSIHLYRNCLT
jgi:hypothetical protein